MKQIRLVFGISILVLFGVGCTTQKSETSKVSFVLPKVSTKATAQSGETLHMVMIRVTGAGMDQIAFNWDLENECRKINCNPAVNPPPAPDAVALDVSKGQRLFQVLVVLKDSQDRNILNYGDASKNLTADAESLRVNLQALGGAASEVTVTGRYLTSAGNGPTGTLQMLLNPPTGAPAMEIQNSDIIGGYFSAMFLDNTKFTYKVKETGEVLFAEKTLADMTGLATSDSRLYISLPDYYRDNGNCRIESGRKLVAGFFGSIPTNAQICREGTVSNVYSDSGCSTSTSIPDGTGGVSTCATNPAIPQLKLLRSQFGNGLDGILGFRGPFKMFMTAQGYYDFIETALNGTQATLTWAYIDGGQSAISGNDVFYTTVSGADFDIYDGMNGLDCKQLASSSANQFASLPPSTLTHTINDGKIPTAAAVCPYRMVNGSKQYMYSAIRAHSLGYSGGSSPSSATVAFSGFTDFDSGVCQAGTVTITPASGYSLTAGTLELSGEYLEMSDSCGGTFGSTRSVAYTAGTSTQSFNLALRMTSNAVGRIYAHGFNIASTANFVVQATTGTPTGSKLRFLDSEVETDVNGAKALIQDRCYPILFHTVDASLFPVPVGAASTATLSFAPTNIVKSYSDPSCTLEQATVSFAASDVHKMAYLKASTTGATSLSWAGLPGSASGPDLNVGPAVVSNIDFAPWQSTTFTPDSCVPVNIRSVNTVGAALWSQTAVGYQFEVTSDFGTPMISTESNCSSPVASPASLSFPAYYSSNFVYIQAPSGATTLDMTLTTSGSAKSKSMNYP